ncbi:MAG: hypothetical protein Q8K86_08955 [Candidatus Nanopelagicaceae bacterium]|nr:hypothetical protein [Candidatus Nanopelagicaceae bacterium]
MSLDDLLKRSQKRTSDRDVVVNVRSLADIKRVINNFRSKSYGDATVSTEVEYRDGSQNIKEKVSVQVKSPTPGALLLEGLSIVKKGMDYQQMCREVYKENDDILFIDTEIDSMAFWVDALIKNRLGGKRTGLKIRWSVPDGDFEWDPTEDKFEKLEPKGA